MQTEFDIRERRNKAFVAKYAEKNICVEVIGALDAYSGTVIIKRPWENSHFKLDKNGEISFAGMGYKYDEKEVEHLIYFLRDGLKCAREVRDMRRDW